MKRCILLYPIPHACLTARPAERRFLDRAEDGTAEGVGLFGLLGLRLRLRLPDGEDGGKRLWTLGREGKGPGGKRLPHSQTSGKGLGCGVEELGFRAAEGGEIGAVLGVNPLAEGVVPLFVLRFVFVIELVYALRGESGLGLRSGASAPVTAALAEDADEMVVERGLILLVLRAEDTRVAGYSPLADGRRDSCFHRRMVVWSGPLFTPVSWDGVLVLLTE